jgi:hypothetical protein
MKCQYWKVPFNFFNSIGAGSENGNGRELVKYNLKNTHRPLTVTTARGR